MIDFAVESIGPCDTQPLVWVRLECTNGKKVTTVLVVTTHLSWQVACCMQICSDYVEGICLGSGICFRMPRLFRWKVCTAAGQTHQFAT